MGEFEAHIPKKGLEEKGKEPLLKVGAVCCDCGEQEVCKTRGNGLRILRSGKEEAMMPGSESLELDAEKMINFVMSEMGFVKGQEPSAKDTAEEKDTEQKVEKGTEKKVEKGAEKKENKQEENTADLKTKMEDLKEKKRKATEDEDFKLAGKLKKEIDALEKKIKK